jgi:hypothetical protein
VRKQRSSSPATHPTSTPRPNPASPDGVQAGDAAGPWQGDAHFARTCLESGVLRQSICHYQKRRATYRDILERRARENQIDFIEGVATARTPLAFLETVMVKSYETLVDSDTKVDVNTGIIAVGRLKSLIDSRGYSRDLLVMKVQLGRIADAVKSTVPQEMWGDVVQKLEELEQDSQALDVGTDSFDDDDDDDDPSIRPSSSTRTTSFDLRSTHGHRWRWGPLPVWTGRSRSRELGITLMLSLPRYCPCMPVRYVDPNKKHGRWYTALESFGRSCPGQFLAHHLFPHIEWYYNLKAHPECELGGEKILATEVTDPDEYARLY